MPDTMPRTAPTNVSAAIIEPLARAVDTDRASALACALAHIGAAGAFEDATYFAPPDRAHYSRKTIWRDPRGRFAIVCMTWLPGQRTPIHDHDGRWGAEFVVRGAMSETTYACVARAADGRRRLAAAPPTHVKAREVGVVVPTVDVHAFHNVGSEIAHTVHVYSSLRDACTIFSVDGDGWSTPSRIELG